MQTTSTWHSSPSARCNSSEHRTKMSSFHVSCSQIPLADDCNPNIPDPAFNLIEIIFLILPFEWWMPSHRYERLNHYIMGIIYSPLLLITAAIETRDARRIRWNRRRGEADDNVDHEWEELAAEVNMDLPGLTSASSPSATPHTDDAVTGSVPPEEQEWIRLVEETKPNVGVSAAVAEIQVLKEQVRVLTEMVKALQEEKERKDSATE